MTKKQVARSFVASLHILTTLALISCGEGFQIDERDAASDAMSGDAASGDAGPLFQDGSVVDGGSVDASSADAGREDSSVPADPCDPPNPCAGACAMPWLLATAEDLHGTGCGGRVFRYSLADSDVCACPSYQTPDDDYPRTVSYIPGGQVLVGTSQNAFTFGRSRDTIYLGGGSAVASFVVEGEELGSEPVGILTVHSLGGGLAKTLYVFDAAGTYEVLPYDAGMSVTSNTGTQNPANPRGYRSADVSRPSVNRLFWEGGAEDLMHFAGGITGDLEAFYAGGLHRTTLSIPDGVRHVGSETLSLNNSPAIQSCAGDEYEDCRYLAAAPDPTSARHVYVVCEQAVADHRASRIARLDLENDSCEDLLPLEHWRRIRISHLSVGMEDYWER